MNPAPTDAHPIGTDPAETDRRMIKRALMTWGTGRDHIGGPPPATGTAVAVLETADTLPAVLAAGLVGATGTVFVGGTDDAGPGSRAPGRPRVVGYRGSAAEPGEELSVGDDFFLQIQDYATSEYMSLLGPTLIRLCAPQDLEALLADADRARGTGEFAAFATNPAVQFADRSAYAGDPTAVDGPSLRLWVDADGAVSTSPDGALLGDVSDGPAAIAAAWREINRASARPCAVSLGRAVPEAVRVAALAVRPWLPDYLAALEALKDLHARGHHDVQVSGFGGRRSPALAGVDGPEGPAGGAPVLLWTDRDSFLVEPRAGRSFRIDPATADAVESLVALGSIEAAAAVVDPDRLRAVAASFAGVGVRLVRRSPVGAGA